MPSFLLLLLFSLPLTASVEKPNFQDDLAPIFEQSCNSCHNPDKAKGGLDLTGMNGILAGGSSGEVVWPGEAESSLLYLLSARLEEPHMPPRGEAIEQASLDMIKNWINQGLLPTASGKPMIKKKASIGFSLDSISLGKPEGDPPMPRHLSKEPVLVTPRSFAPASLAKAPWSPIVAIAGQKQVLLYHTETLGMLGVLPFPEGFIESLNFSKNGKLLLAGGGRGGKSGRVIGWDVETGKRVLALGEEQDSILTADISPDQSIVAIGGPSKLVKVFDLASGEILYQINKHSEWVTQVAISPDGILLATGDRNGGLHIWETKTGNPFYTLDGHKESITDLSWRIDSNMLVSSSEEGTIRAWEMQNGKQVKSWEAHAEGVLSVDFDHNANIVSAGRDRKTVVWDLNGNEKETFSGFSDMVVETCFSHDGKRVIAADWTGEISVWDSQKGNKIGYLSGNPSTIEQKHLNSLKLLDQAESNYEKAKSSHHSLSVDFLDFQSMSEKLENKLKNIEKEVSGFIHSIQLEKSGYEELNLQRAEKHKWMQKKYSELKNENSALQKAKANKDQLSNQILQLENQISSALTKQKMSTDMPSQANQATDKNLDGFVSNTKKELAILKKDFTEINAKLATHEQSAKSAKSIFEKSKLAVETFDLKKGNKKKELDKFTILKVEKTKELESVAKQLEEVQKKLVSSQEKLAAADSVLLDSKHGFENARREATLWQAELINLERHRELEKLQALEERLASLEEKKQDSFRPEIDQVSKKSEELLKSYLATLPK